MHGFAINEFSRRRAFQLGLDEAIENRRVLDILQDIGAFDVWVGTISEARVNH